jgi:hypothetical protein
MSSIVNAVVVLTDTENIFAGCKGQGSSIILYITNHQGMLSKTVGLLAYKCVFCKYVQ